LKRTAFHKPPPPLNAVASSLTFLYNLKTTGGFQCSFSFAW